MDVILQLTKEEAKLLYPIVSNDRKAEYEKLWGRETFKSFKSKHYTDIKLFEDACTDQGINPDDVLTIDIPDSLACYKRTSLAKIQQEIIAKSICGEWVPDYENNSQQKWYCWFNWKNGVGFVFGRSGANFVCAAAGSGSRLCFETKEKANYFGRQFIAVHNIAMGNLDLVRIDNR
jgi:hypothetical protein